MNSRLLILNNSKKSKIKKRNQLFIELFLFRIKNYFGDRLTSVYLVGSVSRGDDIEYLSDIDFIIFINNSLAKIDKLFVNFLISNKSTFKKIDLSILEIKEYDFKLRSIQNFVLKTDSVIIHGIDYRSKIKNYYVNIDLIKVIYPKNIDILRYISLYQKNKDYIVLKRIVKMNFRLMLKLNIIYLSKYHRKIKDVVNTFLKIYPNLNEFAIETKKYYYEKGIDLNNINNYIKNTIIFQSKYNS